MLALPIVTAVLVVGITALLVPVLRFLLALYRTRCWLRSSTIPGPDAPHVLKGHLDILLSPHIHEQLADWADTYGPIYRLQLAQNSAVVVTDPEEAPKLLRKGSPDYVRKSPDIYEAFTVISQPRRHNMFSDQEDSPLWRAVRTGLAPCLSITNLKKLFPRLQQLTRSAVTTVGAAAAQQQELDVGDLAKRITSDVMGSMLLDQDFGGMEMKPDPYMEAFNQAIVEAHAHMSNPLRPYMWWSADVRAGKQVLAKHDQQLERKLVVAFKAVPPEHTIAGHLLNVRHPATGQPLDMAQLKSELGIVLGAGFETTSHAISWTLGALATHPGVQAKLAAELSAAGLTEREFDWGDLARLPYLNAVIKESLRVLAPASTGTVRIAHRDMTICGHHVPKTSQILIPLGPIGISVHNYGPTARIFSPERWLTTSKAADAAGSSDVGTAHSDQGAGESPGSDAAAGDGAAGNNQLPDPLSFSTGPRDCVGQALARLELCTLLASLLAAYKWSPGAALQRSVDQQLAAVGSKAAAAAAGGGAAAGEPGSGLTEEQEKAAAVMRGLYAMGHYHITFQPKAGLYLKATPRTL